MNTTGVPAAAISIAPLRPRGATSIGSGRLDYRHGGDGPAAHVTSWTTQQVLALAPDASAAKAGQSLASPRPWSELGQDERAVWGLCQGSGKEPYQTQVDLSEPALKF